MAEVRSFTGIQRYEAIKKLENIRLIMNKTNSRELLLLNLDKAIEELTDQIFKTIPFEKGGNVSLLDRLKNKIYQLGKDNRSVFVCKYEYSEVVIQCQFQINMSGRTKIINQFSTACIFDKVDEANQLKEEHCIVPDFVSFTPDPDYPALTALTLASSNGAVNIVEWLLSLKVDLNEVYNASNYLSPVIAAANSCFTYPQREFHHENNRLFIIKLLFKAGIDISKRLHWLTMGQLYGMSPELLQIFLEQFTNLEERTLVLESLINRAVYMAEQMPRHRASIVKTCAVMVLHGIRLEGELRLEAPKTPVWKYFHDPAFQTSHFWNIERVVRLYEQIREQVDKSDADSNRLTKRIKVSRICFETIFQARPWEEYQNCYSVKEDKKEERETDKEVDLYS